MAIRIRKVKRIPLNKGVFYFSWVAYSIFYMAYQSSELSNMIKLGRLSNFIIYFLIVLLTCNLVVNSGYKKKELFYYTIFLSIIFLITLNRMDKPLLLYILFILNFRKIEFNRLVYLDIKVKLACLFFVVSLAITGIIQNYSVLIFNSYKQAFGFSHPNFLGLFCYSIIVEWLYLRYKKMKVMEWGGVIFCSLFVFQYASSRTSGYTFALIFVLFVIARFRTRFYEYKLIKLLFTISMPLMAATSILLTYLYMKGNMLATGLNYIMSGRLGLSAGFLNDYGINLFGQEVELIGTRMAARLRVSTAILDMGYIRAPILYGVVYSLFFLIAFILLMNRFLKERKIGLALFALYYVLFGLGESHILTPIFNMPMLFMLNAYTYKWKELKARMKTSPRNIGYKGGVWDESPYNIQGGFELEK